MTVTPKEDGEVRKMKNKITDLNDHLFAELERLGDEELAGDDLQSEITRAKAIADVSGKIIDNAKLALEATKLQVEYGSRQKISLPEMLEMKSDAKRSV